MATWLTTHYPHHSQSHPWFVYFKDKYKSRGEKLEVGDDVFFFELAGKQRNGRQAVVGRSIVSDTLRKNVGHREDTVDEGTEVWPWEVPCVQPVQRGCMSRADLFNLLDWPASRPMQITAGIMLVSVPIVVRALRDRFAVRGEE